MIQRPRTTSEQIPKTSSEVRYRPSEPQVSVDSRDPLWQELGCLDDVEADMDRSDYDSEDDVDFDAA